MSLDVTHVEMHAFAIIWRSICFTSHVLASRKNVHHHTALLRRFRDSGAGHNTADLLAYLLIGRPSMSRAFDVTGLFAVAVSSLTHSGHDPRWPIGISRIGSFTFTFCWIYINSLTIKIDIYVAIFHRTADDHEPHCRHVPTDKIQRHIAATWRSWRWRSQLAGINSDYSALDMKWNRAVPFEMLYQL